MVNADVVQRLKEIDTPTICNALEVVAPERRLTGFTTEPLVCPFPDLPPIVGFARTATIRAACQPEVTGADSRAQRLAYYEYVAGDPAPSITVIQDLDGAQAGFGAFWGEVQSALHSALGCLGVITDGCVRDIPDVAPGFQMLARSIAPSHAYVHLDDFGKQVRVAGMIVRSGDLIHADMHGAVVIPHDVADKVPDAADLCGRREEPILSMCRQPGFTVDKLREALSRADEIH